MKRNAGTRPALLLPALWLLVALAPLRAEPIASEAAAAATPAVPAAAASAAAAQAGAPVFDDGEDYAARHGLAYPCPFLALPTLGCPIGAREAAQAMAERQAGAAAPGDSSLMGSDYAAEARDKPATAGATAAAHDEPEAETSPWTDFLRDLSFFAQLGVVALLIVLAVRRGQRSRRLKRGLRRRRIRRGGQLPVAASVSRRRRRRLRTRVL